MAINDVYTTYICRKCNSKVDEIPINDYWGYHVLSKFKCINEKCNIQAYCYDDGFSDNIETIFNRVAI